ncbi:MAG: NADH:ubiquinone reductase (Na(+)-transporting) subunit C [Crocinitomicaceae bacterium]
MAVNKDSNGYTFMFAIALVVVVGAGLASISIGLKPFQEKNGQIKKKMDILAAIKVKEINGSDTLDISRQNAEKLYDQYIIEDECIVINNSGNEVDKKAFDVNIKKQYRDKELSWCDRDYPLYVAEVEGSKKYIMPMVGSGLWGPIWGFIAVDEDKETIYGATFDHKTETPGLGAEIKQEFYYSQYVGEKISGGIKSVKDGSGKEIGNGRVDGITGGTITSKGVEEMVNRTLAVYVKYFNKD